MSIRNLFFLFLGYLPDAYGSLNECVLQAQVLQANEVSLGHQRLADERSITLPTIRRVSLNKTHSIDRRATGKRPKEEHGELDNMQHHFVSRGGGKRRICLHPLDTKAMVMALLEVDMPAHTFICGDDPKMFLERLPPERNHDYLHFFADQGIDVLHISDEEERSL
ncbi:hypothetical protein BJY00DRAFT_316035 [Aspergillus carlsbadensis]|nr:hypothetical protein BJY00DRAFT_316035 [Aspergillus carlsbadensis]